MILRARDLRPGHVIDGNLRNAPWFRLNVEAVITDEFHGSYPAETLLRTAVVFLPWDIEDDQRAGTSQSILFRHDYLVAASGREDTDDGLMGPGEVNRLTAGLVGMWEHCSRVSLKRGHLDTSLGRITVEFGNEVTMGVYTEDCEAHEVTLQSPPDFDKISTAISDLMWHLQP